MAPIGDETARALQDLVQKLDQRVKELESKVENLQGGSSKPKSVGEEVRMILMGPPGAGTFSPAKEAVVLLDLG